MSHLGTRILYHTINQREDTYCERVFAPWPDMEEQLSKAKTNSAEVIGNVKLIEKNMNEVKKLSDDLDGKSLLP